MNEYRIQLKLKKRRGACSLERCLRGIKRRQKGIAKHDNGVGGGGRIVGVGWKREWDKFVWTSPWLGTRKEVAWGGSVVLKMKKE